MAPLNKLKKKLPLNTAEIFFTINHHFRISSVSLKLWPLSNSLKDFIVYLSVTRLYNTLYSAMFILLKLKH